MRVWQLQEAKACLSELIKEAINQGPQEITLRGEPAAIVISVEEYEKLTKPKPSFVQFMRQSPLAHVKLIIKRDSSLTRENEL